MSAFTPAGSGGVPITADIPGIISPTVANVSIPLAGTEQSYTFPLDTKQFLLQLRGVGSRLQFSYVAGTSGTTYVTLYSGAFYAEKDIDNASLTIYFQASQASQTLEILSWI